jgi:hypothetical protein
MVLITIKTYFDLMKIDRAFNVRFGTITCKYRHKRQTFRNARKFHERYLWNVFMKRDGSFIMDNFDNE